MNKQTKNSRARGKCESEIEPVKAVEVQGTIEPVIAFEVQDHAKEASSMSTIHSNKEIEPVMATEVTGSAAEDEDKSQTNSPPLIAPKGEVAIRETREIDQAIVEKPTVSELGESVLVLTTTTPATREVEGNQITLRNIFNAKLNVGVVEIDGAIPDNLDMRKTLFDCSSLRGKYPQVFIRDAKGEFRFVGDFETLQSLNDSDSLPQDLLASSPEIPTFSETFKHFMSPNGNEKFSER